MLRLCLAACVMVLMLSACNLGNEPEPEELPTETPTTEPVGKPQVTIVSPRTGDEFEVDEQILVSVNATDTGGVTGIQLIANGSIVKSVSSPSPGGDKEYPAVLDYTPRVEGEVRMQVIAFRGATASDPASITVNVGEADEPDNTGSGNSGNNGGTTGGNTGPVRPNIPNDGVCRALTTTNLNFRSRPTTSEDNVITVLPTFTLVQILGRLPDNSWWKIIVGNQQGWVSANFTEEYGNCSGIQSENPLLTPTPSVTPTLTATATLSVTLTPSDTPVPPRPDLVVPNIGGERELVIEAGESSVTETYSISVSNVGAGPATAFDVVVEIDGNEVQSFGVSSLNNGQTISLSAEIPFTEAGDYDLRVEVDPENDLEESIEVNNRGDITITVTEE